MFCYNNVFFWVIFGCCSSEKMSDYALLSNTPITKFCPNDLKNIYKIYEKHPDMPEMTMCCATRITHKFMLTEKSCFKKFIPKYITVNTLKKKLYSLLYNLQLKII